MENKKKKKDKKRFNIYKGIKCGLKEAIEMAKQMIQNQSNKSDK